MQTPVISVITVVFNGASLLEGTIRSVMDQNYSQLEYIVVDGQSTDGTVEIIERYQAYIDRWVSEPDQGLYDAMNKGLTLATGDYVWFVNAGDHIFAPETVKKMVEQLKPNTDVIYGEVMMVDQQRQHLGTRSAMTTQKLPENLHWKSLRRGMVVSHQAFLPRRAIAPSYLTDNLSADVDWVIKCLKKAKHPLHTHLVLAEYLIDGLSKQKHGRSLWDRYKILARHYGMLSNFWNHIVILARAVWYEISSRMRRRSS